MCCCCWTRYNTNNRNYLKTTIGCLKSFNIIFGITSLILLSFTEMSTFEDTFALFTVTICCIISIIYVMLYIFFPVIKSSKRNKLFDNFFHILAGFMLILAGTDLVGFASKTIKVGEQYFQPGYIKGSAKIFIFINGVIYEIIAFIKVKGEDDSYDYFENDEETDLLGGTLHCQNHHHNHHLEENQQQQLKYNCRKFSKIISRP